ncbi:MAG TPA: DUF5916 domain-containing protein [Longimicrobiales bacterium]|nr:DUF5916 domain-containing protein [Longimicrobiales bacterium]
MNYLKTLLFALTATIVATPANAQSGAPSPLPPYAPSLATTAPVIDGKDNDEVWTNANRIDAFRVFDPTENGEPRWATEARIAYDARNLYIFVRMFDPHPDSLQALLSRRDVRTASDQIKVMIDSYYDRRSGYEFAVNPAGVKRDYSMSDDVREDVSWDGVWDAAAKIDSLGWTAEFRIPLSQLRYRASDVNTMGVMIWRDITRTNERLSWPAFSRTKPGIVSQFAQVDGFRGLSSPRRVELLPYAVSRNRVSPDGRAQEHDIGGDARIGIGSNLTLTAAIRPDFGQVEADPAVINLSAFETSFAELRPFFVEGANAFGRDQTLFYSRRIGAGSVPIDAAAKLAGRLPGAVTLGALGAYADHQLFALARAAKDLRGGASGLFATMTLVDRDLALGNIALLRDRAITGALGGRHRFRKNTYQAELSMRATHVSGSTDAIARTQRNSVHYFQRPDGELTYDPTLTALDGTRLTTTFSKVAGAFQFGASYDRTSPGFESNDLGFLSRADQQYAYARASLTSKKPRAFWTNAQVSLQSGHEFTSDGLALSNYTELDLYSQFKNTSYASVNMWVDNLNTAYCDRCARGGPALRVSPAKNILINLQGDNRRKVSPYFAAIYTSGDYGRSYLWRVRPLIAVRNGSRVSWEFASRYQKNQDNTQWVTNRGVIGADSTHYVFGHLNQDLLSFSARLNYTVTPTLSFQYYAEPFVSTGRYSNLRELSGTPRASDYDARFRPTSQAVNADFNVKSFNSNAVVRWEYRPGSSLYVVWQQGRSQGDRNRGTFDASRDYRDLFGTVPNNTFLVKASYWLNL